MIFFIMIFSLIYYGLHIVAGIEVSAFYYLVSMSIMLIVTKKAGMY